MATRKNTFLLKRSNVAGNIPTAGQIQLGELALNTADVKLYASGTTTNSILPIGWDRISRTGDTMTGTLYVPTISATTYQNLPLDIRVTGGTYAGGTATFTNNTGGTFTVTGFGGGSSTGLTASNYIVQGKLAADQTIPNSVDTLIAFVDDYDSQGWYDPTSKRFTPTIAGYYLVDCGVWMEASTGTTGQSNLQARFNGNTIAIVQSPNNNQTGNSFVFTKIVYFNGTSDYMDFTFYQLTGVARSILQGTANGSGTWFSAALMVGGNLLFTGGTISGPANAIAGFSANTISATTYYNLPIDVRVTGGTYNAGTATFTNNTGGTFNVTGLATQFTGGTVAGATNFTGGLTANTISATTYYNLPNDLPISGTTGQILAKNSNTNYDVTWIDNYTSQLKHEVKAGEAISIGQAVYVSSANGTNMIVSKASNATEATSSKTLGLLAQSLALNGIGFVITEGLLAGLNTGSATAGDPVWLGTNGNLIFGLLNKPVAPAHLVYIGVVTRAQTVNGEIFVRPQNGFEFNELHDVLLTGVTNGDLVSYDSSTSLWKNSKTLNGVYSVNGSLSATTMSAVTFTGNLTGTASLATSATTALNATNVGVTEFSTAPVNYNITFVGGVSGNQTLGVDSTTLTYNPSTSTLTAPNFSGLASLATSATTALNATNAASIFTANLPTTDILAYPTFVTGYGSNRNLYADSTTLTYNPFTNVLTLPNIVATGTITATTVSATTYLNLPTDIRVTGGTYSTGTATFTNNTGGTFTVTGFNTNSGTVTQVNSGNGMNFSNFTTSGTITMGTPSSTTLVSTNATTTNSHTHAFAPGGTTAQYITGAGTLVTFPTIPTVNDGTLTLNTSGIASGSASFTANQAGASTFTVSVPSTNLSIGVSSGTQVRVDSSTGADVDLPVASATLAGILTTGAQTFAGTKTFSSTISGNINGTANNSTLLDNIASNRFVFGNNGSGSNGASTTFNPYELSQYKSGFWDVNGASWTPTGDWYWGLTTAHQSNTTSYNYSGQQVYKLDGTESYFRTISAGSANTWRKIWHDGNITPVPTSRTLTINGTTYDLSANRSWTISGGGGIAGGGTSAYIPKFTGSTAIGNSLIYDNGSGIAINTTSTGGYMLNVNGGLNATAIQSTNGINAGSYLAASTYLSAGSYGQFRGDGTGDKIFIGDPFSNGPIGLWDQSTSTSISVYDVANGEYQFANRYIRSNISSGYVCINGSPSGSGRFEVQGDNGGGNVSIYATNDIIAFSDISIKENLRPIENVLDRVVKSRGVLYDRTDNNAKDNIGFVAQELEEQFPELVSTNPDGTKAVKYQNATAVLFEAVKEQQKQIDSLQEQINNILNKLDK